MAITQDEIQSIVNTVLSSIRTNSQTIDQLTPVTSLGNADYFEINGGKRVSYMVLKDLIVSAFTSNEHESLKELINNNLLSSVSVTTTDTTATLSISSVGKTIRTTVPIASTSKAGLMTASDKQKLESVYNNSGNSTIPPGMVVFNDWADETAAPISYVGTFPGRNIYLNEQAGCFFVKLGSGETFNNWDGADDYGELCYDETTGELIGRKPVPGRLFYCIADGEIYRANHISNGVRFVKMTHNNDLICSAAKEIVDKNIVSSTGGVCQRVLHQSSLTQYSNIGEPYYAAAMKIKVFTGGVFKADSLSLNKLFPSGLNGYVIYAVNCDVWYNRAENKLYWDVWQSGREEKSDVPVFCPKAEHKKTPPEVMLASVYDSYEKKIWLKTESGAVRVSSEDWIINWYKQNYMLLQTPPVDLDIFSRFFDTDNKDKSRFHNIQIQRRGRVCMKTDDGKVKVRKWVNIMTRKTRPSDRPDYLRNYGVYRVRRKSRRRGWSEWRYFVFLKHGKPSQVCNVKSL